MYNKLKNKAIVPEISHEHVSLKETKEKTEIFCVDHAKLDGFLLSSYCSFLDLSSPVKLESNFNLLGQRGQPGRMVPPPTGFLSRKLYLRYGEIISFVQQKNTLVDGQ